MVFEKNYPVFLKKEHSKGFWRLPEGLEEEVFCRSSLYSEMNPTTQVTLCE